MADITDIRLYFRIVTYLLLPDCGPLYLVPQPHKRLIMADSGWAVDNHIHEAIMLTYT